MSRFYRFWRKDRNDHSVDNFVRKNYNALLFSIPNNFTIDKPNNFQFLI